MKAYIAQRLRFRNGERISYLKGPDGLPVHEVTLHLEKFRKRGLAANTIHLVCHSLALLYSELARARIDILQRIREGQFLTGPELARLASATQHHVSDLDEEESKESSNVISIKHIRMPRTSAAPKTTPAVDTATQASRIRYMAGYLEFLAGYFKPSLPPNKAAQLESQSSAGLKALREHVPKASKRAKLNAREGLSKEDQDRVLRVVHPASPDNPWKDEFVKLRNWVPLPLAL